jgi:hypothetical protein
MPPTEFKQNNVCEDSKYVLLSLLLVTLVYLICRLMFSDLFFGLNYLISVHRYLGVG